MKKIYNWTNWKVGDILKSYDSHIFIVLSGVKSDGYGNYKITYDINFSKFYETYDTSSNAVKSEDLNKHERNNNMKERVPI